MTDSWPRGGELEAALDRLLLRVEKPTRYLGGEWNSVSKDASAVETSVALAFPDLYDIGMSHLGFRILYALLAEIDGLAAERVFMPWTDMLEQLRVERLPLTTLESRRPLCDCDVIGFSLQYELTLTNVLAMLDLGGVPLRSTERRDGDPLVIAGGPVAVNPEPFADFFDLILIGDGEEAFPEALARLGELRREGARRTEVIRALAGLEGWYAPALYDVEPEPRLGMLIPRPKPGEPAPARVRRRVLYDLDRFPFPEEIVVPHSGIVHDRVSWEIQRGCPVGCRFCQAGYIYRPTRERNPNEVAAGVSRSVAATGYDEFSLTSLNTGEYGAIEGLLTRLMDEMEPRQVSVGLSSLHASTMSEGLVEQVRRVRKTGFTIAPEAGSQRMRDVINKNLTEEQILAATRRAFEAGWQAVKLYFMIGLPGETDEDVLAQAELAARILDQGRRVAGRRSKITLSASTFVPKVFTPFQWVGMQSEEETRRKQRLLKRALPRGVTFRGHDHRVSWLEGVLSRADRSVAPAILEAYRRGAVLDGWTELFNLEAWVAAFEHCGIDADELASREIPLDAELPWDVVDPLVKRNWLEREYARSRDGETVVPCGPENCTACAPFARECMQGALAERRDRGLDVLPSREASRTVVAAADEAQAAEAAAGGEQMPPRPVYRYRASFSKKGRARFLGHLDLVRALLQGFRRAGIQVGYTEGFKPRPKVSLSPALGLGIASREEFIDFELARPIDPETFLARVNASLAPGLRFSRLISLPRHSLALQDAIRSSVYEARVEGYDADELRRRAETFLSRSSCEIVRRRKGKEKTLDIRPLVEDVSVTSEGRLRFMLRFGENGSPKPTELIEALTGESLAPGAGEIERVGLLAEVAGRPVSPLLAGRPSAQP